MFYNGGMARDPWLTTKEAAAYLRTSEAALRRLRGEGRLTAHRVEGTRGYRYNPRDLDELVEMVPQPPPVPARAMGREAARALARRAKIEKAKRKARQKVLEDLFEQQQGQLYIMDAQRRLRNERGRKGA